MAQRVLRVPGRVGDIGSYRDRQGENKKYPNKRRKIVSGKELTTPLGRKRINEAQKERYKRALKEKILIKRNVVKTAKNRMPAGAVCLIAVFFCFLLGLICSYIVLYEKDTAITKWSGDIYSEEINAKILERELEVKNDLNAIISCAVNELGMVREDSLPKQYLAAVPEDEVAVMGNKNGEDKNFQNILSAFSKIGR